MLIELRVIGEDAEEIKKEVAQLAEALGVVAGDVALTEGTGEHTVVGTGSASGDPDRLGVLGAPAKTPEGAPLNAALSASRPVSWGASTAIF